MKKSSEPKKKEEVHEAILALRKKYGEAVITKASEGYPPVSSISTECFAIDRVIGCGGLPRGRIIELYGEPSCQIGGDKILLFDGKFKKFKKLKEGDFVLSPQRKGYNLPAKVIKINKWISKYNYRVIEEISGKVIYTCSSNHLLPVKLLDMEKEQPEDERDFEVMNITAEDIFRITTSTDGFLSSKLEMRLFRLGSNITYKFRVEKIKNQPLIVYGIVLDSPSQWYITNDFYVTHNSGKTATTLYLISEIQKKGGTCAFLDAEYSFNVDFASSIGVDTKKLFVSQPATLEEGADTIRALVATNEIDLIVVDSVAALVPKREVEGEEMLANSMAVQAQLMSKMLRVLTGEVARSKTVVVFINHLKDKMGVFWGDKSTTPGGKSLKFFSSVRLAVSKGEKIKGKNDEQIGSIVKIVAQKNKVAPPWRKGEFTLFYSSGVDHAADTLDTAVDLKLVEKDGNTHSFEGEKLGIGRERAISFLNSNKEVYEKLNKKVKKFLNDNKGL